MTANWATIGLVLSLTAWYGARWRVAPDAGWRHLAAFAAGSLVAFVAVAPEPLYPLAEERSAIAHVVLLILLMHLAPLLYVWAITPGTLGGWAVPVARVTRNIPPAMPLVVLAVVAYGWHVPVMFDAATGNGWLAALQHGSFVLAGAVVWLPVAGHARLRPELKGLAAFLYMTADELILGALGIVLTWAPRPLYDTYVDAPSRLWGLDAKTDQTVAGAVLTVVEEAPIAVALAVVFIRMLQRDEEALRAEERAMCDEGPQ